MSKRLGETAHDDKTQASPQTYGALVGADYEIELHGAESELSGALERVRAHGATYAAARGPRRGHVPTVGDVRAPAQLIGTKKVSAHEFIIIFGDEDFMTRRKPVGQRAVPGHVARQGVRFAGTEDGFEDGPNCIRVAIDVFADVHELILP